MTSSTITRPAGRRRRFGAGLPARWRITAWIMLTTLLLLVVVFGVARNLLLRNVDLGANSDIEQEASEFRRFAAEGVDPTTSQPFESVERMLEVYLARQSAGQGEVMAGVVGEQIVELPGMGWPGTRVGARELIVQIADGGPATGVALTADGELRWGRVPITGPTGEPGTFVVGVFTEHERQLVDEAMRTIALVGLGGLVLTTGVAYLVAGRILAPVRSVREVATEISESDLSARVPVTGHDDVADLARTFNSMLDRLAEADRAQRQFIDDTGHELRTPITVVRGHLELLPDDPEERDRTLALVDSELQRMTRIVSDLLLLAKAQRPDFIVLAQVPDVATLTLDIESKTIGLGDREWLLMEVAEGPVLLDPERVTQAMLQLATNAVAHTAAGSTVRLGSRFISTPTGRRLRFWVTDTGPGVRPEDAAVIFTRFGRGSGRPATRSGAGLGLAIVHAIAEGHRVGDEVGIAWVDSVYGQGATFGIDLPAPPVPESGPDAPTVVHQRPTPPPPSGPLDQPGPPLPLHAPPPLPPFPEKG